MTIVRRLALILVLLVGASSARAAFLEPGQAFRFSARAVDANAIEVTYAIADGYYLYRERFKFALDPAASGGATLGEPVFPKGEVKYDETFAKDVEHYRHEVVVRIPVSGATGPLALESTSQGCADAGLCYPPQTIKAALTIKGSPSGNPTARPAAIDDASRIESTLKSGNFGWIALLFVGLGLLLAFTPCVLPMVPILSSIIVGHSRGRTVTRGTVASRWRWLTRSGHGAGLHARWAWPLVWLAKDWPRALQKPWVLLHLRCAAGRALALSMFDVYDIQVPAALQASAAAKVRSRRSRARRRADPLWAAGRSRRRVRRWVRCRP